MSESEFQAVARLVEVPLATHRVRIRDDVIEVAVESAGREQAGRE